MSKDTEYWKGVLKEAREQHHALSIKRDALDVEREYVNGRIVQLEQLIASLRPVTSEDAMENITAFLIENATEIGLADAVREVLKNSNKFMTPIYIRDMLTGSEYDLSQYSNPLASIHGVLKRMEQSGEVEMHSGARGTMYRWKNVGLGSLRQYSEVARAAGSLVEAAQRAKENTEAHMETTRAADAPLVRPVRRPVPPITRPTAPKAEDASKGRYTLPSEPLRRGVVVPVIEKDKEK